MDVTQQADVTRAVMRADVPDPAVTAVLNALLSDSESQALAQLLNDGVIASARQIAAAGGQ